MLLHTDTCVTLPMPKGTGLLAETSYVPGVRRNYLAFLRMARILGAIRSVPRMLYPLAATPAERREHSVVQVLGPKPTKPGFIAQASGVSIAHRAPSADGPAFIPCLQAVAPSRK